MAGESALAAFIGGFLSFFSPCFLPLVPAILAYLGSTGQEGGIGKDKTARRKSSGIRGKDGDAPLRNPFSSGPFLHALAFSLGFTIVFTLLGVLFGAFFASAALSTKALLSRIGGILIFILGLSMLGIIRLDFIPSFSGRLPDGRGRGTLPFSFFIGCVFSLTLSPCVGAILGGIMLLASVSAASSFLLFFSYSLGLALPLLVFALFLPSIRPLLRPLNRNSRYFSMLAGAILALFGLLAMMGALPAFS